MGLSLARMHVEEQEGLVLGRTGVVSVTMEKKVKTK